MVGAQCVAATCRTAKAYAHAAARGSGNRAQRFHRASSVNAFWLSRVTTGVLSRVMDVVAKYPVDARAPRGPERRPVSRHEASAFAGRQAAAAQHTRREPGVPQGGSMGSGSAVGAGGPVQWYGALRF